jgi:glycosyltransferase involved in cell wall biosynthesis
LETEVDLSERGLLRVKVLIAIPAFNEEATLGGVIAQLPRELPGVSSVEVFVVDDGSTDRTAEVAGEAGARVIRHRRNLGLGEAFNTAVREALEAGADALVTIDADGQFDAAQIPELLEPLREGCADVVTGSRFLKSGRPATMPRIRYLGNLFFSSLLNRLLGEQLRDVSCGFRAYSREALLNLNLLGKYTYTQESLFDLVFKNLRVVEVPIRVTYTKERQSRVAGSLVSYGLNALKILARTARDFKPLRFFGVFAVLVFGVGALMDAWLLLYFVRNASFTPYKFVGFTGTALIVVGILILGFALLADMLDRLRVNQERVLYQQRKPPFHSRSGRCAQRARGRHGLGTIGARRRRARASRTGRGSAVHILSAVALSAACYGRRHPRQPAPFLARSDPGARLLRERVCRDAPHRPRATDRCREPALARPAGAHRGCRVRRRERCTDRRAGTRR